MSDYGEMIQNPGFEYAGDGGSDIYWYWIETTSDGTSDVLSYVAEEASYTNGGTGAMNLSSDGTACQGVVRQYVEVIPSTSYTVSLYVRGDGASTATYRVRDHTNGDNLDGYEYVPSAAQSFQQVTKNFTAPSGCYEIQLSLRAPNDAAGTAIFDDVSMRRKDPSRTMEIVGFGDAYADMETLPDHNVTVPHGAGRVTTSVTKLPDGRGYDWGRTDIPRPPQPQTITISGEWVADTNAEMALKAQQLNGMLGKRSKLWREADSDNIQWRYARCTSVESDLSSRDGAQYAGYKISFETDGGVWHGDHHTRTWTSSEAAGGALHLVPMYVLNNGNAPVTDATFTFQGYGTTITNMQMVSSIYPEGELEIAHNHWQYSGTVYAGDEIEVDSGSYTITHDDVDAYDNLELLSYQKVQELLYIQPGLTFFSLSLTGGQAGATAIFDYYDGWY